MKDRKYYKKKLQERQRRLRRKKFNKMFSEDDIWYLILMAIFIIFSLLIGKFCI